MTAGRPGGPDRSSEGPGSSGDPGWSPPPYGSVPSGPARPASWGWGAAPPVQRPSTVKGGIGALVASMLIGLIAAAFTFTDVDALVVESVAAAEGRISADAARGLVVLGAVLGLVLIALEALVLWFAWQGHHWARVVLWVVGGITVVTGIVGLAAPTAAPGSLTVLALLQLVLTAAGLVLLALRPSDEWYRYRGSQRQSGRTG